MLARSKDVCGCVCVCGRGMERVEGNYTSFRVYVPSTQTETPWDTVPYAEPTQPDRLTPTRTHIFFCVSVWLLLVFFFFFFSPPLTEHNRFEKGIVVINVGDGGEEKVHNN